MTHVPRKPFAATCGNAAPRIVLLGEAFGGSEANTLQPFVGMAGKECWRMLGEAFHDVAPAAHLRATEMHRFGNAWIGERREWLDAAGIAMTNVLAFQPPDNKVEALCGSKTEVGPYAASFPPIQKGKYLREEYLSELVRLEAELSAWQPNLVVACGNTAIWALLQATNIGSIRGTVTMGRLGGWSGKVLPTYHPAGVMRQWSWRPIVVSDFMKASREAASPEIIRPKRRVLVEPTIHEVLDWTDRTLAAKPKAMACDIETRGGQISCIGFAPSREEACVIPFIDFGKPNWSYWDHPGDEKLAWNCVDRLCRSDASKIFQNGLYDLQYIMKMGIMPNECTEDTMLLHHSLFPELQKGLGFLGSIYSAEPAWKLMRHFVADTVKRDE